jgi:hypothetical protein
MPNVSQTYIANRLLRLGVNDLRQPGQLVPEAGDWGYKIRKVHLDLEWLKEIPLVSDADRQAVQEQWQEEEQAREAARAEAMASVTPTPPEPEPASDPPVRVSHCATCAEMKLWHQPPADDARFRCTFCGQWQSVDQARRRNLQLRDPHIYPAFRHGDAVINHAPTREDLTDAFEALLEEQAKAYPSEAPPRANEPEWSIGRGEELPAPKTREWSVGMGEEPPTGGV